MKKILFFSIFSSFLGAKVFSVAISGGKISVFRLTFFLLIFLTLYKRKEKFLIYRENNKFSILFMIVWFIYSIFTFIWSGDLGEWFRNLYFLFVGTSSVIVFTNILQSKDDVIQALHAFQWGLIVQGIIGWYEIFTKDYHFIEINERFIRIYINSSSRVPIAMSGNPNNFATLMFLGVFVSYICCKTSRNKWKYFHAVILISDVIQILMSTSRANIIGLVMASTFLLFVDKKKKIIFPMCLAVAVLIMPKALQIIVIKLDFMSAAVLNSNSIRLNLIKNGFSFLVDTCGVGVGNGQIEAWMKSSRAVFDTEGTLNMHNWWMEILVAYGIVIFIGYLVFYFGIYRSHFYSYKKANNFQEKAISISICAILVGYVVASISSSSNMINESIWIFWAISVANQGIISPKRIVDTEYG